MVAVLHPQHLPLYLPISFVLQSSYLLLFLLSPCLYNRFLVHMQFSVLLLLLLLSSSFKCLVVLQKKPAPKSGKQPGAWLKSFQQNAANNRMNPGKKHPLPAEKDGSVFKMFGSHKTTKPLKKRVQSCWFDEEIQNPWQKKKSNIHFFQEHETTGTTLCVRSVKTSI